MLMQKSKEAFPSLGDWGSYPVLDRVIEAAVAVHARLSLRFTRWRSQRILAALDDRQLSDIGVARADIAGWSGRLGKRGSAGERARRALAELDDSQVGNLSEAGVRARREARRDRARS